MDTGRPYSNRSPDVGFLLAVATQLAVFPIFGIQGLLSHTIQIGGVFTVVSILRSFMLRRIFEAIRSRWAA